MSTEDLTLDFEFRWCLELVARGKRPREIEGFFYTKMPTGLGEIEMAEWGFAADWIDETSDRGERLIANRIGEFSAMLREQPVTRPDREAARLARIEKLEAVQAFLGLGGEAS